MSLSTQTSAPAAYPRWASSGSSWTVTSTTRAPGRASGLNVWREPLVQLRIPKLFDLRADPFEAGEESAKYNDWFIEHVPYQ